MLKFWKPAIGAFVAVLLLVASGAQADINASLATAMKADDGARIARLAAEGVDLNATDRRGNTALILAADGGKAASATALIEAGADLNAKNRSQDTALIRAALGGHDKIVEALATAGADLNAINKYNETALMSAALNGHAGVIKALLAAGADPDLQNDYGATALGIAQDQGFDHIAVLMSSSTQNVNLRDASGETPIFGAIRSKDMTQFRQLLQNGADVNIKRQKGGSALQYAAGLRREIMVRELIAHGARVRAADDNGMRALHNGANGGSLEVVDALLRAGAGAEVRNSRSETPLLMAVKKNNLAVVKRLISHGVAINTRYPLGTTAWITAKNWGNEEIADALEAAGATTSVMAYQPPIPSRRSGIYAIELLADFDDLDGVSYDPANRHLTLYGHRRSPDYLRHIPYLDLLSAAVETNHRDPGFSLDTTADSKAGIQKLFDEADDSFLLQRVVYGTSQEQAISRVGEGILRHFGIPVGDGGLWLGLESRHTPRGAMIWHVAPKGPAAAAGVEPGDLITQIDGFPARSPMELAHHLNSRGDEAERMLTVLRGDRQIGISIAPAIMEPVKGQSGLQLLARILAHQGVKRTPEALLLLADLAERYEIQGRLSEQALVARVKQSDWWLELDENCRLTREQPFQKNAIFDQYCFRKPTGIVDVSIAGSKEEMSDTDVLKAFFRRVDYGMSADYGDLSSTETYFDALSLSMDAGAAVGYIIERNKLWTARILQGYMRAILSSVLPFEVSWAEARAVINAWYETELRFDGIEPTSMLGLLTLEGDIALKEVSGDPSLQYTVPGFLPEQAFRETLSESEQAEFTGSRRFWLRPVQFSILQSRDGRDMRFERAEIGIGVEKNFNENGRSVSRSVPGLTKLSKYYERHYNGLSEAIPVLHASREAFKLMAVAGWMRSSNKVVRLPVAGRGRWSPPVTIPGIASLSFAKGVTYYGASGGVDLNIKDIAYRSANGPVWQQGNRDAQADRAERSKPFVDRSQAVGDRSRAQVLMSTIKPPKRLPPSPLTASGITAPANPRREAVVKWMAEKAEEARNSLVGETVARGVREVNRAFDRAVVYTTGVSLGTVGNLRKIDKVIRGAERDVEWMLEDVTDEAETLRRSEEAPMRTLGRLDDTGYFPQRADE